MVILPEDIYPHILSHLPNAADILPFLQVPLTRPYALSLAHKPTVVFGRHESEDEMLAFAKNYGRFKTVVSFQQRPHEWQDCGNTHNSPFTETVNAVLCHCPQVRLVMLYSDWAEESLRSLLSEQQHLDMVFFITKRGRRYVSIGSYWLMDTLNRTAYFFECCGSFLILPSVRTLQSANIVQSLVYLGTGKQGEMGYETPDQFRTLMTTHGLTLLYAYLNAATVLTVSLAKEMATNCTSIRYLFIYRTNLPALEHLLAQCPSLLCLRVHGGTIADRDMRSLQHHSRVQHVHPDSAETSVDGLYSDQFSTPSEGYADMYWHILLLPRH